ncbi:hypothetical protein ABZ464_44285 [Streptomyces sp. NPDC005820]|uniref:hypothetical protein n=1 Tax=Streptomyces sp. NPDC005820 TaxID=3157069 RepID=UPI0033E33A94
MSVPAPLDHSASAYSLAHAYWLAEAARAAYRSPEQAERLTRSWGFDRFRHFSSPHTMPPTPTADSTTTCRRSACSPTRRRAPPPTPSPPRRTASATTS